MSIERETVLAVARMRDPAGVVSIYVDVDPLEAASRAPTWLEDFNVEVRRLNCQERLHELRREIADVVDPSRHGRGRALFFGATVGGAVHSFAVQLPLETSVRLAERPHLQPLLEALDEARPAGIVIVSMAELRAIELAWGEAADVVRREMTPPPSEWNERKEPNHLHDEDRLHIVRTAAPVVEKLARNRGWDRVVLAGNPRLTRPLAARITSHVDATVVEAVTNVLIEDGAPQVASRLRSHVAAAGERRAAALLDLAHDAALAGGRGAIGVDDVLDAVTEGRAAWVAIDGEAALHTSGVREPAGGVRLLHRADVADTIIERALETDATLTVLSGSTHPALRAAGAVAVLRW